VLVLLLLFISSCNSLCNRSGGDTARQHVGIIQVDLPVRVDWLEAAAAAGAAAEDRQEVSRTVTNEQSR